MEIQVEKETASKDPNSKPISVAGAVLVIVVTFVLALFVGGLILLIFGIAVYLVAGELILLAVPFSYMLYKRIDIKGYVGIKVTPKNVLMGIGLGVVLLFTGGFVSGILTTIFGVSQAAEQTTALVASLSTSTWGLVAMVTSLFLAGVCEEFAFRGFLQNTIARRYSFIPAVIVSSVVFGILHFDPQFVYIIWAFTESVMLGVIYHYSKSYVVAAVAHSTLDLLAISLFLVFGI